MIKYSYLLMSFIFFAPAYPMPTASKFGFISPFLAGVLFLILLIRLKLGMSEIYLSSLAIITSFSYLALIFFNLISFFLHRNNINHCILCDYPAHI